MYPPLSAGEKGKTKMAFRVQYKQVETPDLDFENCDERVYTTVTAAINCVTGKRDYLRKRNHYRIIDTYGHIIEQFPAETQTVTVPEKKVTYRFQYFDAQTDTWFDSVFFSGNLTFEEAEKKYQEASKSFAEMNLRMRVLKSVAHEEVVDGSVFQQKAKQTLGNSVRTAIENAVGAGLSAEDVNQIIRELVGD